MSQGMSNRHCELRFSLMRGARFLLSLNVSFVADSLASLIFLLLLFQLEWNESDDSEGSDSDSDDSDSDSSSSEDDEEEPEGVEIPEGGFAEDQEDLSDEEKKEEKRLAAEQVSFWVSLFS